MISVTEAGTACDASAEERALQRERFRRRSCLKIPGFLGAGLLQRTLAQLRHAAFVAKTHGDIGSELVCWDSPAGDALLFLMNDPRLLGLVQELTDVAPIACFLGRIYHMAPGAAHHASWHSDVGDHRLIGLTVNLSEEPYRGGALVLREQGRPETEQLLENTVPGDALLFRIAEGLEHCITGVLPGPPKTAWAGWFKSAPSFLDVLAGKAQF
jgi:hypothetical protein